MTIRYYLPASSEAAARKVADEICRGIVPALPEYLDPELAAEAFDRYPPSGKIGLRLWCVERRAVDDGRIVNAWSVDKVGDAAAALTLVAILPALAARFWGFLP